MNQIFFILVLIFHLVIGFGEDPDIYRNVTELITSRGYPCEDLYVQTPDGFLLSLQHIPHGKSNKSQTPKPVVLLQHGFLDASHTWVINGAKESLGFILADAGFDVWLGNNRGNIYSMQNVNYNPDQPDFWAWSFDEMAKYDVPTMIDFILEKTNADSLTYVGHSQGTTQAFAAFSSNPIIASKVNLFIALAPVALFSHQNSTTLSLLNKYPDWFVLNILGDEGFPPDDSFFHFLEEFFPTICEDFPPNCENAIFSIGGCNDIRDCNPKNLNLSRLDVYASHIGGASVQDLVHFLQFSRSNSLPYYDFGIQGNLEHYNSTTPPNYDLSQVKVPTAIFHGLKDGYSDYTDVTNLISILPNVVFTNLEPTYEHMDYVWGENTFQTVYPLVVKLISEQNK